MLIDEQGIHHDIFVERYYSCEKLSQTEFIEDMTHILIFPMQLKINQLKTWNYAVFL